MNPKFKLGQIVKFVNGVRPTTIISITYDDISYFYDIAFYGEGIVHRVAENSLVVLQKLETQSTTKT